MNPEKKLLVPHWVEGVAMNGFGPEMAAVQGHPKHIDFDARTSCAVAGAHVLSRHDLKLRNTEV